MCVSTRKMLNFQRTSSVLVSLKRRKNMLWKENKQLSGKVVRMNHQHHAQPSFRSYRFSDCELFYSFFVYCSRLPFITFSCKRNLRGNFKSLCTLLWFTMFLVLPGVALCSRWVDRTEPFFKRVRLEERFNCFHVHFFSIAMLSDFLYNLDDKIPS